MFMGIKADHTARLLLVMVLVGLSGGCENTPPRVETLDQINQAITGGLAEKGTSAKIPDEVAAELIPTLRLDVPEVPEIADEQRFDIAVNRVPADQFFLSLVDDTQYNLVVHPEVTGEISLNLKNVTIRSVLEAARDVYGFEFDQTDYGFQVLPARLEARVYQINYLNINRSGTSATFVSSGTLQEGPGSPRIGNAEAGAGADGRGQRTVVGTTITTIHPPTSFWNELQTSLEAIVGDAEGRSVVVNPQSGVVVARAIPTELREVEAFLRATQLIAQRQVIIEAKILEVELSEGFQSGINWAAIFGQVSVFHTGGGTNLLGESGLSDIAGADVTQEPGVTDLTGVAARAFGGVFSMAFNGTDFTAFIELLETQGNVQVLSSPRIATMNNHKAIIKVGTDEFFVTDVSTTTITATATQSTPNIELTPFFSGIALDVTPQISEAGDVMLHIHPTVSQVTDQQKNISIGGINQTLPLARSTVRESDSIVRARNGQLIVIGGLMQNRSTEQDAKTPFLGDLPGIGALFRHKRTADVKSELVILLRPTVIAGNQQWAEAFGQTGENMARIDRALDRWDEQRNSGFGYGKPSP
ncbi:MAG: pilus (MSHA type) biogenesis protein MshL [Gammaproteobacteria bacterium]|nr:pilus (MSHA type) biogenesis protein MshL [Gammaproteobacteria bacterium]